MARRRGHNEGSYYQLPTGRWRAQVSLEGRRLSKTVNTRQEAIKWIEETKGQIARGLSFAAVRATLEDFMGYYLKSIEAERRPATWKYYNHVSQDYIIPDLGTIKLKDIRPERIQSFYNELTERGKSAWTVNKIHVVLHQALKHAYQLGLIPQNPASKVIVPRLPEVEKKILDEDQVEKLLKVAANTRHKGAIYIAVITGMRMGELLGLTWDDLDWEGKSITVNRQLDRTGQLATLKTKHGKRAIALGDQTIEVLRQHQEQQDRERQAAGDRWQENNLIFPSSVGTPMNHRNMLRDFKKILARADLEDIRFHDLRHTSASLMLNHGVPVIIVSRRLGHSRPSITLDLYGHLIPSLQADAAEKIENLVNL